MESEAALRRVRWHLYHYWDIKRAISRTRVEMNAHGGDKIGGIQDSRLSDPTAAQAIRNATPLRFVIVPGAGRVARPEAWIDAIDAGLSACSDETRTVARESFLSGVPYRRICAAHSMEQATLYRTRDKAVLAVALAAAEAGLISVMEDK